MAGSGNGGGGGFLLTTGGKAMLLSAATIAGAIMGLWQFSGNVADALPFAPKEDFIKLAGEVRDLKRERLLGQMRLNRQLRYDNLAEQKKYTDTGQAVPPLILRDAIDLEEELQELERQLNRLDRQ